MPLLPTNTPQETLPIKSFTVNLTDGTSKTIEVEEGASGYFKESLYTGGQVQFKTFQAYVACKPESLHGEPI